MSFARLVPVALGALLLGCAHTQPSHEAARAFHTRRTPHFLIHSDAGEVALLETARRLEDVYAALASTFFAGADVPLVEVLVFADPAHYRAVVGNSAGAFYPGIGRTGSVLVMNDQREHGGFDNLVAHELTHRFVNSIYPTLPNWLGEGLAMFFESVVVDSDRLEFGAAPRAGVHGFAVAGGIGFADLLAVRPARLYGNEARFYYTASWGLVHYLFTAGKGALRAHLPELFTTINAAVGDPQQIAAAFTQVFPDQTPADFDAAIVRNNQRIRGTVPEGVLRKPFSRPPPARLTALPDEPEEITRLLDALARRRRRTGDTGAGLEARPRFVRLELGLDVFDRGHLTYAGLVGGRMLARRTALEAELGLGELGLGLSPRVRQYIQIGDDGNFFLTFGAGPLLALDLGHGALSGFITDVPEADTPNPAAAAFFGGLASEVAAEIRTPSHVVVRVVVAGYLGWATAGITERRGLTARAAFGWTF